MTSRLAIPAAVGLCVSLLSPFAAKADVMFSNFGPSLSYDTANGNPVGGGFDANNYAEGSMFTPSATGTFGSIQIALSLFSGSPSLNFTVALNSDNGGLPGAVIESFTLSDAVLGPFGNNNAPLVLNSAGSHLLTAGTRYWITVATADASQSILWNLNSTGDNSDEALSTDGGASWIVPSGFAPGAFQVNSVAVPEPSGLLGLAMVPVAISALKKARKTRTA